MLTQKKHNLKLAKYFDDLPHTTTQTVTDLLKKKFETLQTNYTIPDVWSYGDEAIECHARAGFSPFSHNRGGIKVKGFSDLMGIWGSGVYPKNNKARKEIERQIDCSFEYLSEDIYEQYKYLFTQYGLTVKDANYNTLSDLTDKHPEFTEVLHGIQSGEWEYLGGSENSIMYELRFMYHGMNEGKHTASVSAALNTEGPYHRSYIPWAPGVMCEVAKEVEIEWTTDKELADKLDSALAKVCKQVF